MSKISSKKNSTDSELVTCSRSKGKRSGPEDVDTFRRKLDPEIRNTYYSYKHVLVSLEVQESYVPYFKPR